MFHKHYARLVRLAMQMTGDHDEGRDIVADVMEQAWRRFDGINPEHQGAWLYRCTANACLNRLKHLGMERSRAAELATMISSYDDGDYAEHERLLARAEITVERMVQQTPAVMNEIASGSQNLNRRRVSKEAGEIGGRKGRPHAVRTKL